LSLEENKNLDESAEQASNDGCSSVMQRSITNSSFQKRRLSDNRFEEVVVGSYNENDESSNLLMEPRKQRPDEWADLQNTEEEKLESCVRALYADVCEEDRSAAQAERQVAISIDQVDMRVGSGLARAAEGADDLPAFSKMQDKE
jgi:hypothetical protein